MEDLKKARAEGRFEARKRICRRPRLPAIDEFGMRSCDRRAAAALFAPISDRHLRNSIVFASNKAVRERGEIFDDPVPAAAVPDRVPDRCRVLGHPRRQLPAPQQAASRNGSQLAGRLSTARVGEGGKRQPKSILGGSIATRRNRLKS